ncbi:DNA-3-methyladenine glycosylase II, partial [Tremellales sp. Uapishka_1]
MAHLTAHDARFGRLFAHLPCRPFVAPLKAIDPFKTLVTSIIGQQVSWMAARAINGRFRGLFGYAVEGNQKEQGEGDDQFPRPDEVVLKDVIQLKEVGLSTRKAEYVIELARHFLSGQLSLELLRDGTDEEIAKALIAVRGIGQWTVDMFLIFSLRRPNILPVGDLGVQKGLLKWALAAHGALPASSPKKSKGKPTTKAKREVKSDVKVVEERDGEVDTLVESPAKEPHVGALHASHDLAPSAIKAEEAIEVETLPPKAPEFFLNAPTEGWDEHCAAPLGEGMTIALLKERLAGKKAKGGAYLTPKEMECLTEGWKPYRSLGVVYTWSVAEDL